MPRQKINIERSGDEAPDERVGPVSSTMWHYLWQNQQVGPIPENDLRRYLAERRLPPETMVWSPGMAQWSPASQVPAFQLAQTAPVQQQVAAAAPPTTLSPSEVVFFHADRFAPPAGMLNSMPLIHMPTHKVNIDGMGQALMAVAFLAAEQAGSITLTVKEQKALFGLKTNKVLDVGRGPKVVNWPPESFEAGIASLVQQGRTNVGEIIYHLLLSDSLVPAALPYYVTRDSLVRKGLLDRREEKGLLGSVTYHFSLTDSARHLAASHDPTPWLQLIGAAQQSRTELWAALIAGIQNGFGRRRESDTSSSGPDLDFD